MAIDTNNVNFSASALNAAQRRLQGISQIALEEAVNKGQQASISANDSGTSGQNSRGFLRQQYESEDKALARLAPIKPNLSPSDEVAIFASDALDTSSIASGSASSLITNYRAGEAVDANGESVAVEIITNDSQNNNAANQPTAILSLDARQQYAASQLYARNEAALYADYNTANKLAA